MSPSLADEARDPLRFSLAEEETRSHPAAAAVNADSRAAWREARRGGPSCPARGQSGRAGPDRLEHVEALPDRNPVGRSHEGGRGGSAEARLPKQETCGGRCQWMEAR